MKSVLHLPLVLQEENFLQPCPHSEQLAPAGDGHSDCRQSACDTEPVTVTERSDETYSIEKKPVIACVIVQRRGEIFTHPCVFEGSPAHILQHETVLGVVPAPPGIYAVEYLSEVMEDEFDDEAIPVDLGYEWPNRSETPDWQTKAGEVEERRRIFFGLSPAKRAEILKAAE